MQQILKLSALGVMLTALTATTAQATTVMFTATRVVSNTDRHAPAENLLNSPIRIHSDDKLVLIPQISDSTPEVRTEKVRFVRFRLVKFQKIGSVVTFAKAVGNSAMIEMKGNTDQSGRIVITTTTPEGQYRSQAVLEGCFSESVF